MYNKSQRTGCRPHVIFGFIFGGSDWEKIIVLIIKITISSIVIGLKSPISLLVVIGQFNKPIKL